MGWLYQSRFQNEDCVYLAENLRDTGSDVIFLLFGGVNLHSLPQLDVFLVSSVALQAAKITKRPGFCQKLLERLLAAMASAPWPLIMRDVQKAAARR